MFNASQLIDLIPPVYEGIWKNHNAPLLWTWTWTLSDTRALFCLACISMLLAFTQTRSWVLFRFFAYQRIKPPQLPGAPNTDPRRQISQACAITDLCPLLRRTITIALQKLSRRASEQSPDSGEFYDASPLFGLIALFNIFIFLTMAILIPWVITDGSLEAPLVKSKATEGCLGASMMRMVPEMSPFTNLPWADLMFRHCQDRYESCTDELYSPGVSLSIQKTRTDNCPFPGNVCRNDTMSIDMTHSNITAYSVGVNTHTTVTVDHHLICAPIVLDSFYVFKYANSTSTEPYFTAISILDPSHPELEGKALNNGYTMPLATSNGPHFASRKDSGVESRDLLPRFVILPQDGKYQDAEFLHPDLRTEDSSSFLFIYRAGGNTNEHSKDDPLFSAHKPCTTPNGYERFCADREVTALGCAEKFRFCMEEFGCTAWARNSESAYKLLEEPSIQSDEDTKGDILTLYRMLPRMLSVESYLGTRQVNPERFPPNKILVSLYYDPFIELQYSEPWAAEVETWFRKATVDAIQLALGGMLNPLDPDSGNFDMSFRRKYSLCGRIVFKDDRYTNISWIEFWIVIVALGLTCLASYFVESLHHAFLKWKQKIVKFFSASQLLRNMLKYRIEGFRSRFMISEWWNTFRQNPFTYPWRSNGPQSGRGNCEENGAELEASRPNEEAVEVR